MLWYTLYGLLLFESMVRVCVLMSLILAIKFTFFPNISFCVLAAKEKAKWDRVWIMINMEEVSASPPGGGGGGGGGD